MKYSRSFFSPRLFVSFVPSLLSYFLHVFSFSGAFFGIVTGLRPGRSGLRVAAGAIISVSSPQCQDPLSTSPVLLLASSTVSPYTKRPIRETGHSPPSGVEIKNDWSPTSTNLMSLYCSQGQTYCFISLFVFFIIFLLLLQVLYVSLFPSIFYLKFRTRDFQPNKKVGYGKSVMGCRKWRTTWYNIVPI